MRIITCVLIGYLLGFVVHKIHKKGLNHIVKYGKTGLLIIFIELIIIVAADRENEKKNESLPFIFAEQNSLLPRSGKRN